MRNDPEPVAYIVEHDTHGKDVTFQHLTEADKEAGWRETPLYREEQLKP